MHIVRPAIKNVSSAMIMHSIKSLEGMDSRSQELGAELRMNLSKVNCDALLDKEKVAVVAPVTSVYVEVTGSKAMFALCFSTLSLECLIKTLGTLALG